MIKLPSFFSNGRRITGFLFASALLVGTLYASHGRYFHVTWTTTANPGEVEFVVTGAFRNGYGVTTIGDYFYESIGGSGLDLGDGNYIGADDWHVIGFQDGTNIVIARLDPGRTGLDKIYHTYAAAGTYDTQVASCCRIGGPEHINNPSGYYVAKTTVTPDFGGGGNASPVSSMAPIVQMTKGQMNSVSFPVVDANGDLLSWRLATSEEASGSVSGFTQPGPPHAPNALYLDPVTATMHWDTTGASENGGGDTFYSCQIIFEDGLTQVPIDFLIELVDYVPGNDCPEFDRPPTPNDGKNFVVMVGDTLGITVQASDVNPGDTVTVTHFGIPSGSSWTVGPGTNPASGDFSWTPVSSDVGTYSITFGADDTQCSVVTGITISVQEDGGNIYVCGTNPDCPNANGTSGNPWCAIQEAIDAAVNGDIIVVCPGVYPENINFLGKSIIVMSQMGPSVTTIDGQSLGSTVTFQFGETSASVLDGFTVTNGMGTHGVGGGIRIDQSSPMIVDCIITGNDTADNGGGLHARNGSHPTLHGCVFEFNHAGYDGGGVYQEGGGLTMVDCTFEQNSAERSGGGIYVRNNAVVNWSMVDVFTNTAIGEDGGGVYLDGITGSVDEFTCDLNTAGDDGGGIYMWNNDAPLFSNSQFNSNTAGGRGGGVFVKSSISLEMDNVTVYNNHADSHGGGFFMRNDIQLNAIYLILANNSSDGVGGGIFMNAHCYLDIDRATITANSAPAHVGEGIYGRNMSRINRLRNSIVWDNGASNLFLAVGNSIGSTPQAFDAINVTYTDLSQLLPGSGNMTADPLFVDVALHDYHLQAGSPCIDAGDPGDVGDLDGSQADMGAWPTGGRIL